MASPRTAWSGAIRFGLLTLPVTIGKASDETSQSGLVQVCYHGDAAGAFKISRNERCEECGGTPKNKQMAVEVDGGYRLFDDSDMADIEAATKSEILEIDDVQPLNTLPLILSKGAYFVRHNESAKGSDPEPFATFVLALKKMNSGAVVKWGSSANDKLCVLSADGGILMLRVIPMVANIRPAGTQERLHWKTKVDQRKLDMMIELLGEIRNEDGFKYAKYENNAFKLRSAAVDAILRNEDPQELEQLEDYGVPSDWMAELEASLTMVKS